METFIQAEHGTDNLFDIFFLVIGRNNNDTVAYVHRYCDLCFAKVINFIHKSARNAQKKTLFFIFLSYCSKKMGFC